MKHSVWENLFTALILNTIITSASFAQNTKTVEELLSGYLRTNLTLLKLSSEVQNQELENKSSLIENGIAVSLSTGSVTISTANSSGTDNNGYGTIIFSSEPQASLTVPQASNLNLSFSSSIEFRNNEMNADSTEILLEADIFSGARLERKIKLMESERKVLEAKRALQNGFLTAEKEFYEELRSLYKTKADIITAQKDLYEDTIEFEKVKAQGYSSGSSKYRLAKLELLSDEHKIESYRHELEHNTRIFALKCGLSITDAADFLPKEIPEVQPVKAGAFDKNTFTETETALWNLNINSLKRKADQSLTLKAGAGYTFANDITDTKSDTIDATAALTLNETALTLGAGIYFPTDDAANPSYKFSLGLNPNKFRTQKITDRQKVISEDQEKIAVESARNNYITSIISQNSELEDILWSRQKNSETYKLYSDLEADTKSHFEQGIISESEYKTAEVNKENYRIQCLLDQIDLIIYNNNTKLKFTRDEEIIGGNIK